MFISRMDAQDMGTIYSRNQLKGMLDMYAKMKETDFGQEETNIMAGSFRLLFLSGLRAFPSLPL